MGDTNLDRLGIVLTASAKDANDAIDSIIDALTRLNGALNNFRADSDYMKGLNNLASGLKAIRISLNGLDPNKIKEVSKVLDKLASSGSKLSQLTGFTPKVDDRAASQMTKVVAASDEAIARAKELGEKYHFDGDEGINKLAEAIQNLYSATGNDEAIKEARQDVINLLEAYSLWENEAHELAKAQNDAVKASHIKLNDNWQEYLGGDSETAKRNRGMMGIANSSKQGGSAASIVSENTILGLQEVDDEGQNVANVLELVQQNAYNAAHEMVGFNEANVTVTGGMQALEDEADELLEKIGVLPSKISEMKEAVGDDDFMDIDTSDVDIWDDPAESVQRLRDSAQEAAPAVEALSTAEQHLTSQAEPMMQVENLFSGIVTSLQSLQGISLPDSLKNIDYVANAVGKLGGKYAGDAAANLNNIATALRGFNVKIPDYGDSISRLAAGLSKLGGKKISDAFDILTRIQVALNNFQNVHIDPTITASIQQLGDGLYRFGLAKMDKAVTNIPALAQSLTQLVSSLSTMPQVSENTIRLVTALGNMNVSGSQFNSVMGGINNGLRRYRGHAMNARKASMSLAAAFGKMYANFFIFFRLINRFKKDIDLAAQLTEVQNVVDVTFADMADKMNEFSKSSIEALGMSELTAKQIGSKYQAMGKAMGISTAMAKSTNDFVQTATNGYADVANSMADISINLTRLAGDMASFYNQDYEEVAERLQAVFTGQTRPLRAYGLDLTQATLKEWALKNGMEANIKTMTQAEKTLLRYKYVMANTAAAHNDFQRTQSSWANQTRIATEKLNQLRIVLGKIAIYSFKPLVQNFNKAMDQILKGAEGLLNALGKIFGWQIEWQSSGVLQEEAEDADDLADGMGDAADNAKKFKNFLLGIDELNLLPDNSDKNGGLGDAIGDLTGELGELGGFNIKPIERGFESIYDTLFKLGKRINEILKELLQGIDWDGVYKKARNFGKGFAKFVNGLLADSETFYEVGKFLAGGINSIANVIDAYHKEFDGFQWGVDIGNVVNGLTENLDWTVIQSAAVELAHDLAQTINGALITVKWSKVGSTIAEGINTAIDYFYTLGSQIKWSVIGVSISEAINGFFATFDFIQAAETLNIWAKGLLDALIEALDNTDWKKVGKSIGQFIARLDVLEIAGKIAHALWEAINGAISAWSGMLETAPIETALATALVVPFSNSFFRRNVSQHIMGFARNIGATLSKDLTKVFNGSLFRNFGNAFLATGGQLDAYGNLVLTQSTSTLQGIANGFNAVSASLSTVTKAIGSLGVGFAEFFVIQDAIYDIVHGTDDLALSIAELSGAAGVASVALSALLGVPTGLIVAGATAGVAAIFGISKALDQISEDNALSSLTRDLGETGTTLDTLALEYKSNADNITGGLDKMVAQADKLATMKSDLNEMLGGLELIKDSAGLGAGLTNDALEELVGNIGEIKQAWQDYINAQYDYLIQSTINNYRFLKSQGDVTEEETQYYKNRINELTKAKMNDIQVTTDAVQAAEDAWKAYNDALNENTTYDDRGFKIITQDVVDLKVRAEELTGELLEVGASVSGFGVGNLPELDAQMNNLKSSTDTFVLSLSNIDASSLDEIATAVTGFENQIQETYNSSIDTIDKYKQSLIENGLEESEAVYQTKAYYDAIYTQTEESLNNLQTGLYEKYYNVLAKEDKYAAAKYAEQIITPFVDAFPDVIGSEGTKIQPTLEKAINTIFEQAFEWRRSDLFPKLVSNWKELYYQVGKDVSPDLKQLGERMMGDVAGGVTKGSKEVSNALEETAEKGGKSMKGTLQAMADVKDVSKLAMGGVIDFNTAVGDTSKNAVGVKDITTNFELLKTILGGMNTTFIPVKAGFAEFTAQTQTSMMQTSRVFGDSFTSIIKYGTQTINWMKNSFIPYFSGAYWTNITASIPNAFGNAFRQAITIMQNMWKQFATWANANMKINANVTKGSNGVKVQANIPQYSTGGFPEDGFFFANHSEMVGTFSNGKSAVANNEQIVEGIKQGVYEAVSAAMQGGSQGVTVELVGDASDIFTAVVKENNRTIMRTGTSPIRN